MADYTNSFDLNISDIVRMDFYDAVQTKDGEQREFQTNVCMQFGFLIEFHRVLGEIIQKHSEQNIMPTNTKGMN